MSAGSRRRCIFLPRLCGFPVPSPFREWTAPSAWPPVLPSTSLSAEKLASAARRKLSLPPRPLLQRPGRSNLPHPSLPSAVPGALPVNQPDPWGRRTGRQYRSKSLCRFGAPPDLAVRPRRRRSVPHAAATAGHPSLPTPSRPLRHSCGAADSAATAGCACGISRCCPWLLVFDV